MYTILVVEDDASFRQTLTALMESEQYTVIQAANYKEALMLTQKYKPHLILCDIKLGMRSGLELLQQIKTDSQLSQTIIIVITGLRDLQTLAQVQRLGADAFFSKPFDIEAFLSVIREFLAKNDART